MKKVVNFLYKNRYLFLIIILYLFLFIQMQNIFLYDDDFTIAYPLNNDQSILSKISFIFEKMNFFWNQWSGRIVGHFTVTSGIVLFGIQFFRILNPIIIFILCFYCTKIIKLYKNIDFKKSLFYISLIFISTNISIARETIYWTYGGILYIWGFTLDIIIVYLLLKNNLNKKNTIIISLLIILQAFMLEQINLIIVGFLFILLVKSIINKNINKKYLLFIIIASLCFIISILAPGNFSHSKIEVGSYVDVSIIKYLFTKILIFLSSLFDRKIFGIYMILLSLLVMKKTNKIITIYLLVVNVLILLNVMSIDSFVFDNKNGLLMIENYLLHSLLIIIFVSYLILLTYSLYKIINKKIFILFVLSIISILMPVFIIKNISYRYLMPLFIITIIILLSKEKLFNNKIINIVIILIFSYNLFVTYSNYSYNKDIILENENRIINSKDEISLKIIPYKYEKYTWHLFYTQFCKYEVVYDYLYPSIEKYYGIDSSKIKYEW